MEKNINIIKTKPNDIEFELEIEGVDANDEKVNFVIETKDVDFSIPCKKINGKKWSVTIPEMEHLDATLYKFHINVLTSGYYFRPFEGTLNVVKSAELYVKNIENKTAKSTVEPKNSTTEKPKEEKKVEAPKQVAKPKEEKPSKKEPPKPKSKLSNSLKSEINKIADKIVKADNNEKNKFTKRPEQKSPTKKTEPKTKGGYKVSKLDEKVRDILNTPTTSKVGGNVKFTKGDITEV